MAAWHCVVSFQYGQQQQLPQSWGGQVGLVDEHGPACPASSMDNSGHCSLLRLCQLCMQPAVVTTDTRQHWLSQQNSIMAVLSISRCFPKFGAGWLWTLHFRMLVDYYCLEPTRLCTEPLLHVTCTSSGCDLVVPQCAVVRCDPSRRSHIAGSLWTRWRSTALHPWYTHLHSSHIWIPYSSVTQCNSDCYNPNTRVQKRSNKYRQFGWTRQFNKAIEWACWHRVTPLGRGPGAEC